MEANLLPGVFEDNPVYRSASWAVVDQKEVTEEANPWHVGGVFSTDLEMLAGDVGQAFLGLEKLTEEGALQIGMSSHLQGLQGVTAGSLRHQARLPMSVDNLLTLSCADLWENALQDPEHLN
jgi:hypothetical protein